MGKLYGNLPVVNLASGARTTTGRLSKGLLGRPRRSTPTSLKSSISLQIQPVDPWNFDKQTSDTILKMIEIVKENVYSPEVIAATSTALAPLSPFASDQHKMDRIFRWIKKNVRFQDDWSLANELIGEANRNPEGEDFLIAPRLLLTLSSIKGDCDDFAMLGATMLLIAGFKCKFITVAADAAIPNLFSHVYLKAWDNQKFGWISFDSSHGNAVGWEYNKSTRYKEWAI